MTRTVEPSGRVHWDGGFRLGVIFSWSYCRDSIWGWRIGRCWCWKPERLGFTPGFQLALGKLYFVLDLNGFLRNSIR